MSILGRSLDYSYSIALAWGRKGLLQSVIYQLNSKLLPLVKLASNRRL